MENDKYGMLLTPDIKLHREWFKEMTKLIGINVIYRAPAKNKHYTTYAEIESNYQKPVLVGCIFEQHPDQKTLKKLGWVSELQKDASIIHVPYDLPDLQQGSLFIVPSGIDNAQGRLFRVISMMTSIVYPASVSCEIVPEYEDIFVPETSYDYSNSSHNLLNHEKDNMYI